MTFLATGKTLTSPTSSSLTWRAETGPSRLHWLLLICLCALMLLHSQRGDFAQKHPDFPACSRLTWCTYSLIHLMFLVSPLFPTFIHLFGYSATHLVGGVLHKWLSFWKIFLFQQKSHWDFVRVTMAFLITSLNKDLLTLITQGKKVLNPLRRVLVVPTFFHLLMMEATH